MTPRPPAADPDTAALIAECDENIRHYLLPYTNTRGLLVRVRDELTRLSDMAEGGQQSALMLVEQIAETNRRCSQIRHLQDGLKEALAENRRKDETIARLRGIIENGESEELARLRALLERARAALGEHADGLHVHDLITAALAKVEP